MNLINHSVMAAAATTATDPAARDYVVVVVKGTYLIADGVAALAPQPAQVPLVAADTFTGPPGMSAPVFESDFARHKPNCDVLVHGTAYSPTGRPVERCTVGVRVGRWHKSFDIVGDRTWRARGLTLGASSPEPFLQMPLSYDRAFGGIDDSDPESPDAYRANPVGRGYGRKASRELVGRPLPNTEQSHAPVTVPWEPYRPMSLGPIHRSWQPRLALAGTYDQQWLDNVFPFLPSDFNERHYQAAPADQQIPSPSSGEDVVLLNIGMPGRLAFQLPADVTMPVTFFLRDGEPESHHAALDTIIVEADKKQMCLVWRYCRPLHRDIFELTSAHVGRLSRGWWRARRTGKTYYRRLAHLRIPLGDGGGNQ